MATLKIKFLATTVQMQMHLQVFLPEPAICGPEAASGDGLKVLWLLHPESGDCSDWIRMSMAESYAQNANIALVMPNMDNSMYMDMAHGAYPYFTYLTQELPPHIRSLVKVLSHRREDNFVAGISTGGYGAVKWMLQRPEMFAGCACFSGELDMVAALRQKRKGATLAPNWITAFESADRVENTADDIMYLSRQQRVSTTSPVYVATSFHDECFERNRQAAVALQQSGQNISVHEEAELEGWPFWNEQIQHYIKTIARLEEQ